MDVTPQELRDTEIREAWRGYHRDDVDELLERAAATIEHLHEQVRALQQRIHVGAPAAVQAAPQQPAPQPVVQAPPQPAPQPAVPERVPVPDTDVIQRTLILAQKAADEAVADAQARARQMLEESESKAQSLVSEAESAARRIAESERKRIEAEIQQLYASRESLTADVDALERFEHEYRERIRQAIEIELEQLTSTGTTALSRPDMHEISLPGVAAPAALGAAEAAAPEPAAPARPAAPAPPATAPGALDESNEPWTTERASTGSGGPPTMAIDSVEPYPETAASPAAGGWEPQATSGDWAPEPAGGWGEAPTAAVVDDSAEYAVPVEEHRDSLDDDAFFASLREAVRDDAPLGPRDERGFYDQDDPEDDGRKLFRRKR
jgi:DivIVA domain-containing protein